MKQVGECVIVDFGARLGLEGGGGRGGGVLGRLALRAKTARVAREMVMERG